jgi:hypothetical protein
MFQEVGDHAGDYNQRAENLSTRVVLENVWGTAYERSESQSKSFNVQSRAIIDGLGFAGINRKKMRSYIFGIRSVVPTLTR